MRFKDELGRDEAWDFLLEFKWFNDLQVVNFFGQSKRYGLLLLEGGSVVVGGLLSGLLVYVCVCFYFLGQSKRYRLLLLGGLTLICLLF